MTPCSGKMAPWAGIEPATFRLTVERSTAELPGNLVVSHRAYNKAYLLCKALEPAAKGSGGHARNRTGVQGFAVLCVTTPPRGLNDSAVGKDGRTLRLIA